MEFISRLFGFALRGFVVRTDALQIVVAAAAPGLAQMIGWELPSYLNSGLPAYLFLVVAGWAALRLVSAPYFIWKEDRAKIDALTTMVDQEKNRGRYQIADFDVQRRAELAVKVSVWTNQVLRRGLPQHLFLESSNSIYDEFAFFAGDPKLEKLRGKVFYHSISVSTLDSKLEDGRFPYEPGHALPEHQERLSLWREALLQALKLEEVSLDVVSAKDKEIAAKYARIRGLSGPRPSKRDTAAETPP